MHINILNINNLDLLDYCLHDYYIECVERNGKNVQVSLKYIERRVESSIWTETRRTVRFENVMENAVELFLRTNSGVEIANLESVDDQLTSNILVLRLVMSNGMEICFRCSSLFFSEREIIRHE